MKYHRNSPKAALIVTIVALAALSAPTFAAPDAKVRQGYLLSPKAFRAAADKVLPSVVTIESIGGVAISPGAKAGKRTRSSGISKPGEGPTTGLILSEDGYIVTSTFNFLKKPPIITVTLNDGSQYVAKLLGKDATRKICLLKIEVDKPLPVPEFVSRDELKVGQWAISLGVGYGDSEPAMSAGIISATSRISGRAVQTDANISPANYGGPLIDITGRVIGVCSPLAPKRGGGRRAPPGRRPTPPGRPPAPGGGGSNLDLSGVQWYDSGIGFAVPVAGAERIIDQLKAGKTVQPGTIGIQLGPVKDVNGVKITKVVDNSPAAKAGLKKDDEIVAADGKSVQSVAQLRIIVGRFAAGDDLKLKIKRGDETLDVAVTLAAPGKATPQPKKKEPAKEKAPDKAKEAA